MSRILVLAPHPDDEVVGCAVAIRRARAAGDAVFILYLTTGVPAPEVSWPWERHRHAERVARRRAEAEAVAQALSATPLGFQSWASRSLKEHIGEALDLIRAIVADKYIDAIWVPAWEGAHQDHDVANFIAAQLTPVCAVLECAEYNFAGGKVRSCTFPASTGSEQVLALPAADAKWKAGLLRRYASERGNLAHCGVRQEMLRPLPGHDYTNPPHDGVLFRERFHWVPFRHPRIDFDPSEAVLTALRHRRASRAEQGLGAAIATGLWHTAAR